MGVATELVKHGVTNFVIVDKNSQPGGLSRTEIFDGARFDVGPHRFFTANKEVNHLWHETLGGDFRPVQRLTRIFYKGKMFQYPIKAVDSLVKLGPVEAVQALYSYLIAKSKRHRDAQTFEEWITQKFGSKLYETFFKTYTEKVWGIPCNQIGAEWAAQRIKGLDILQVIKNALLKGPANKPKTLVDQFDYPSLGAGQMYEAMAEQSVAKGAELLLNHRVVEFTRKGNKIQSVTIADSKGERMCITASHFFTSIPITHFFKLLGPPETDEVRQATDALYYREHITVDLLIDAENLFPDQWIYVHSPDVAMARLANYNNFSKLMAGKAGKTAVSVEYFCFKQDKIWETADADLLSQAGDELEYMNLVDKKTVERGWVVRETESYPTYYLGFREPYEKLKGCLLKYDNLSPIGRGGLYKYNNQDHAILSGLLAARNYLGLAGSPYDVWAINSDAEYLEEATRGE